MTQLSIDQVVVGLKLNDYVGIRVCEEAQRAELTRGQVAFTFTVNGDALDCLGVVAQPLGSSTEHLAAVANDASLELHAPQVTAKPSARGAMLCYERRLVLPLWPTGVVAALVTGFMAQTVGHRRLVVELLEGPERIAQAMAEWDDEGPGAP